MGRILCLLLVLGWTQTAKLRAAEPALPNFDHRLERANTAGAAKRAAQESVASKLQSLVPGVSIDRDELFGGPKFIGSTAKFLTGPNGAGGAVSDATANLFPADEPQRGIKTFLTEHQTLFGFGPEALAAAKVNRDYVSASGGFSTTVWQQHVDGIAVFEAVFKAHLTKNGELINVSSQFVPDLSMASGKIADRATLEAMPPIPAQQAIILAAQNIGDILATNQLTAQDTPQGSEQFQHFRGSPVLNNNSARLTWLPVDAGTLRLCWDISVESRARGELYRVIVDATTGDVWLRQCLTDNISDITMNVWTGESPAPLSPALSSVSSFQPPVVPRQLVTFAALDTNASPAGWVNDGNNTTAGNNVDAHLDWNNSNTNTAGPGTAPTGSPNRVFSYATDLAQQPSNNWAVAVVSLFYWNNWAHDKFYEYGFTEATRNFQANNFGRGGAGGDPVMADAQDSYLLASTNTTRNNANFSTPVDGGSPRMQMYIFDGPSLNRDGDLDASVMVHEYTHGVSSRLVGGGIGISALQTSGMGEGWSDFCALSLLSNPTNNPDANYTVGSYVTYQFNSSTNHDDGLTSNYYFGIRHYPYSVNMNINPLTYKDVDTNQISAHPGVPINPAFGFYAPGANEVHAMGEVWCNTLLEARSRMCHKYGNAAGNQRMLQLVIDGMMLSTPNPTFLQARNAILQADLNYGGGADMDLLWASFAKRGMGLSATSPANSTTTGVGQAFDTPLDTNAPIIAVVSPVNNAVLNMLTSISGTAYDGGSGLQGNQIHFTLNLNGNFWSGTYWTNTSSTDPSILLTANMVNDVWTFTGVPTGGNQLQGTYYVSAFARDNAGNVSQAQSGVTSTSFIISTTPPNVAITSPANGTTITNQPGGNWFQGTASGNLGVSVSMSLYIRRNSDNFYWTGSGWGDVTNGFISNTYTSGTQSWQSTGPLPVPGSSLANGDYHFIAIAKDAAGNQQQVDSVVSVDFHPVYVFNYGSQFGPTPNMNWDSPDNWDVGKVPYPDARVVINGYSPVIPGALGVVQIYGLDMSGGSLTTAGMLIQKLNFSGGSISGGTINIQSNGVFNWSGGTLAFTCEILTNATMNIAGANVTLGSSTTLDNFGTINWTNSSTLQGAAGDVINNRNLFTIQDGSQFYNYTGGSPTPTFNNYGTMRKTSGTNATSITAANGGWIFNQYGLLDIQTGGLSSQSQFNVNNGSSFSGAGATRIEAGTTTLFGNSTILAGGTVELAGGTMDGTGGFTGVGTFAWSSGAANGNHTIGARLLIKDDTFKNMLGEFTHTGTNGVWTGLGTINCYAGSRFNNAGILSAQTDALAYNVSGGAPAPRFVNTGTFIKSGGTNSTVFHVANGGVAFDNAGTVLAQAGIISLAGGGAHSNGTFNAAAGASIEFANGGHSLVSLVTFAGAGRTRITGGGTTLVNSTNTILGGATLELAGGWLDGNGGLVGPGLFDWTGGNLSAVLKLETNLTAQWSGGNNKVLAGGTINNFGTLTWTGSGGIFGAAGSVFNNAGTLNLQNDSQFYNFTGGAPIPAINNTGTIRKTIAAGLTTISPANGGWVFANAGLVDIQTGVLSSQSQFDVNAGGSFSGAGVTRIDGGLATMNGSNYVADGGTFELAYATMDGTGTFNGPGNFTWSAGTLSGNPGIGGSGHLLITSGAAKQLNGTFSNAGTGVWTGAGDVNISAGGAFNNGGTLTASNATQFFNNSGGAPQPVFNNSGTFVKTGNTNVTTFANANGGVAFNNTGLAMAETGVLALSGGGASSNATFNASASARIEFSGGTHFISGGLNFTGPGITRIAGGAVNSVAGTNTIAGGGTFELAVGSLNGLSAIGGPGTLAWTGGSISATLYLQTNLAFAISGVNDKALAGGMVNNAGTATWTGSGGIFGAAGSVFNNAGTLNLQNDSQFYNFTGGAPIPAINNTGTIRKTIAAGLTTISPANGGWVFANAGLVDIQTGVLSSQSQFDVNAGGSFSGAGVTRIDGGLATMNGSNYVANGGTFELAYATMDGTGTFNGPGNFTWSAGTLSGNPGIGGSGHLLITGGAAKQLNGTFSNAGTGVWTGLGNINCSAGSAFNNSGTLTAQNDAQFYNNTGGAPTPIFNNSGIFRKSGATNTTTFSSANGGVNFNSPGTVDLQTGALAIYAGYTTAPSAQLKIALGGVDVGTGFGQEFFGGNAVFDGTLAVVLTNGYVPTNGQSFTIASFSSSIGQFAVTQLPALPVISKWQLTYNPTSLVLQVVPSTAFQSASLTNGNFRFVFAGQTGSSCLIEVSTNLLNWKPLLTNAPFNGILNYVDPQTAQFPKRFYRATIFP